MTMLKDYDKIISTALMEALEADISEYEKLPDHKFSYRFRSKMKKTISDYLSPVTEPSEKSIPLKRKIIMALLAVILLLFTTGAALTVYKLWNYYHLEDYRLYSILNIDGNGIFPDELKERYAVGADMSEFTKNVYLDEYFGYGVEYKSSDENIQINFEQSVKEAVQNILLNTEDALKPPIEEEVNGCRGIFFETKGESMVLIWDVGDYIIYLSATGIGKNELFSLAETVQKVES